MPLSVSLRLEEHASKCPPVIFGGHLLSELHDVALENLGH